MSDASDAQREDGELPDDRSINDSGELNSKRTRLDDRRGGGGRTGRDQGSRDSVMNDWRRCMRDDERLDWEYEERLRQYDLDQRSMTSAGDSIWNEDWQNEDGSIGEPRAMSTKHQRDQPPQSSGQRGPRLESRPDVLPNAVNSTRNATMTSQAKMFKVEPFPKAVKPTEQLQEWLFWLANFEMASEKAGVFEQRAKAIDLSLHIGEEVRRIIVGKEMIPPESSVSAAFPFYDNLARSLDDHFRGLTDESVDVTIFNTLKQGEKETALEFEFRLKQVAKRVNENNPAMIRTRYLDGLRDKDLRERAFVDGLPLKNIVQMATRKEAIVASQPQFSPWGGHPVAVAAVESQRRDWVGNRPRYQRSRAYEYRRPNHKRYGDTDNPNKCQNCGVSQHKGSYCPAEKATCFGCGGTGHFKHMCTKQLLSVNDDQTDNGKVLP